MVIHQSSISCNSSIKDRCDVDNSTSVAKILTGLLSNSSNRKCADCGIQIVDLSQTFASFSPNLGKRPSSLRNRAEIGEFKFNHSLFAPLVEETAPLKDTIFSDPAEYANAALGGHGVFICKACSEAHQKLGNAVTTVKLASNFSLWRLVEVKFLQECGCNRMSWSLYEAFIPTEWKKKKPAPNSSLNERLLFCRAKYDALAFVTPSGGIYAERAWSKLLQRDKKLNRYLTTGHLTSFSKVSLNSCIDGTENTFSTDSLNSNDIRMPNRFVDFFCIVGHDRKLFPDINQKKIHSMDSPEDISLDSIVIDCYPQKEHHIGMEFPEHISQFVFPEGCQASATQKSPRLFTFVLTSSNGNRLYGTALKFYDELMETTNMKEIFEASGFTDSIPQWLTDSTPNMTGYQSTEKLSDILFLPKCLVIISHYPFFHDFRIFLRELYCLSLLETPLPIERYITNFASELPLPPQGKVEIKFGFSSEVQCIISRPAPNQLPLAKFSFRPLFSCLSVSNVMVVAGLLMEEAKVVLLSNFYSLLTPCAEALLSFMFPLEWNGIYIPVMPSTTLDILDAPVPFLVGLHSRYLRNTEIKDRPAGVIFVDLDKDVVHLGHKESDTYGSPRAKRLPPSLPEKDAAKLKSKLQDFAASAFLMPTNGIRGIITYGEGELLGDKMREPYIRRETQQSDNVASGMRRLEVLEESENAYPDSQYLQPIHSFLSEEGQLSHKAKIESSSSITRRPKRRKSPKRATQKKVPKLFGKKEELLAKRSRKDYVQNIIESKNLDLHTIDEQSNNFNVSEIRNAFLRFFTSLLNNYYNFTNTDFNGDLFQTEKFLSDRNNNYAPSKREWVKRVLETQMFQRFLEERLEDSNNPVALFFDESIAAKNNRSKKTSLKVGKRTTPFLDDKSWQISESFTPPAPSNWGLPADGRLYSYHKFPTLNKELLGAVRSVKKWPTEWEQKILRRGLSLRRRRKRKEIINYELSSRRIIFQDKHGSAEQGIPALNVPGSKIFGEQNLNWALGKLVELDELTTITGSNFGQCNSTTSVTALSEFSLAKDITLASRRKQGILLRRLLSFQDKVRNWLDRPIEDYNIEWSDDRMTDKYAKSVLLLQRSFQTYLSIRRFKRYLSAVSSIQRCWRGKLARLEFIKRKRALIKLQTFNRGQKLRFLFMLVKEEIIKIQSVMRGCLVRKHLMALLFRQCQRYKNHIFLLWNRAHIPLSYRSQMWQLFRVSFIGYRILADEVKRVRMILGIEAIDTDKIFCGDQVMHKRTNKSIVMIETNERYHGEDEMSLARGEAHQVSQNAKRLLAERLQVYERLRFMKKDAQDLDTVYQLFAIKATEKKKKTQVLEKLWTSVIFANASSKFILLIFPELEEEGIIKQVKPGRKGKHRLSTITFCNLKDGKDIKQEKSWKKTKTLYKGILLSPIEKDQRADVKIDQLYRKNMSEIAIASMQKMPMLHVKLHTTHLQKATSWKERRKRYLIIKHGAEGWRNKKVSIMKQYLKGEGTHREE